MQHYLEEVLAAHAGVAECAVIGAADALKGETPLGLVVLKANVARPHEEIAAELVGMVRERIGPVASFKVAAVVRRPPKTRSGKIVRGTIMKIADGNDYQIPPTLDDPEILNEIAADLAAIGYGSARLADSPSIRKRSTSDPSTTPHGHCEGNLKHLEVAAACAPFYAGCVAKLGFKVQTTSHTLLDFSL